MQVAAISQEMCLPHGRGDRQDKLGLSRTDRFDGLTEAAVRQCQREHDLVPDGIVGPRTWGTLPE
jgi:peptidoglycan hydrolase-like protein with peptidoglycan-binding domain